MSRVRDWQGVAFNQATASENRIHADDVARRYGFRGGLVPGVTVYAYLVHPALAAWGRDWLERGAATVKLVKPLYDEDRFRVATSPTAGASTPPSAGAGASTVPSAGAEPSVAPNGRIEPSAGPGASTERHDAASYEASVVDSGGVVCATGRAWMPDDGAPPPVRRGDPRAPRAADRPPATREVLERLRRDGMGSLHWEWDPAAELGRYVRALDDVPDLVRPDREALGNPAFTLGLANFVLAANVVLGPWIHVASEVRHHGVVPRGGRLAVEARVTGLFERRGHDFVDLDVAVFLEPDDRPVLAAQHRAIYRLRES